MHEHYKNKSAAYDMYCLTFAMLSDLMGDRLKQDKEKEHSPYVDEQFYRQLLLWYHQKFLRRKEVSSMEASLMFSFGGEL